LKVKITGKDIVLTVQAVPAFEDNYIWLIRNTEGPQVAIVDPGDASPVLAAIEKEKLQPVAILITHHHWDHTGGIADLLASHPMPVYGPAQETIPHITHPLNGGDTVSIAALGADFNVLDVPGHTAGHIAYHGHGALFCGDTLFSAGCGRLFEGTPAQMLASLDALSALPADTRVYCAHEYTLSNLKFARAVEPDNPAIADYIGRAERIRRDDEPTLPSTLELERQINPFLRCDEPAVQAAARRRAGAPLGSRDEVFATVRRWKDEFA